MEITVIARTKVKRGKEADFERALRKAVGPTHGEAGCLRYAIHRGIEDPSTFLVVERWASRAALDAHLAAPHIRELFAAAAPLAEAPAEILTYHLLPEGAEKGSF